MTTPEQRFIPRYYEIEQSLRARIARLAPGDPLPSDAQLVEEFGVSRMTARNATQRLAQEGIILRVPGRGTFVAERQPLRQADNLLSFSDEMRRAGRVPSSRLLEHTVRPADELERARLRLAPGASVVAIVRLRLADGVPVAIERASFGAALASGLAAADLDRGSLHRILLDLGHVPSRGRATLAAEAAGTTDAKLLGLKKGDAVLVERRLIEDQHGAPLELTESRYAGDRYGLEVRFVVEPPRA